MQPLQICIGPIIRIGRESWCLPYAGFFLLKKSIPEDIDKYINFEFSGKKNICPQVSSF